MQYIYPCILNYSKGHYCAARSRSPALPLQDSSPKALSRCGASVQTHASYPSIMRTETRVIPLQELTLIALRAHLPSSRYFAPEAATFWRVFTRFAGLQRVRRHVSPSSSQVPICTGARDGHQVGLRILRVLSLFASDSGRSGQVRDRETLKESGSRNRTSCASACHPFVIRVYSFILQQATQSHLRWQQRHGQMVHRTASHQRRFH